MISRRNSCGSSGQSVTEISGAIELAATGGVDFRERDRPFFVIAREVRNTDFEGESARTEAETFLYTLLRGLPHGLRLAFDTAADFDFNLLFARMVTGLGRLQYYAEKPANVQEFTTELR